LTLELFGAFDLALDRHHEALAIVVGNGCLMQAQRCVAGQGEGGVARQNVDFTRLQGGETRLRVQRYVLHFFAIAQHGGSNGTAHINIQSSPLAGGVGSSKPGQSGVDAANHLSACLDGIQGFARICRGRQQCAQGCHYDRCQFGLFHCHDSISNKK
jgi:hypothetical protein